MATYTRGEHAYQCDTCLRKIRVPVNALGLDLLPNCNITLGCLGKLTRLTLAREINNTPAFPPEITGVIDWFPRKALYTHTQVVQSNTWTIVHDLGNKPSIDTYVYLTVNGAQVLTEVEPLTVTTVDENTSIVTFSSSYSGVAQCISLESQNSVNPNSTAPTPVVTSTQQLSSDSGEVTIATLDLTSVISVTLTYITSSTTDNVVVDYSAVDNTVSIASPWVGVKHSIINGKKYAVRSFNLRTTPSAPSYFDLGLVPSGAAFFVSAVNGSPVTAGQALWLLGTSPYASVDRVYDKVVDVSNINRVSPETFYNNGKGYVQPSVVKSTYPRILVVD